MKIVEKVLDHPLEPRLKPAVPPEFAQDLKSGIEKAVEIKVLAQVLKEHGIAVPCSDPVMDKGVNAGEELYLGLPVSLQAALHQTVELDSLDEVSAGGTVSGITLGYLLDEVGTTGIESL